MIRIEQPTKTTGTARRFTIKPNASLTARQAALAFFGISLISLTIAISFAVLGLWMVLPFSGAELILLGYCLWHTMRQCSAREVITITDKQVRIEKGAERLQLDGEFHCGWARIDLEKSNIKGHPSRLAIRSHGKEIEVGNFLVESEREYLAKELQKSLNEHE
ncbi:MAG: DUF2244 domain-containing protein [Pseudomonadota bacterium]